MRIKETINDVLALTRWREYVMLVWPLTLLPVIMGGAVIDGRLVALMAGNLCSFAFAFTINEVEDAQDDKQNRDRELHNPIALDKMSESAGWWWSAGVAGAGILAYSLLGKQGYLFGVTMMGLALLYSWKKVRLKSQPGWDLISHALVLGGLQYWIGFGVYGGDWMTAVIIESLVLLVSMHGQIHNQIRDFAADQTAGINNLAGKMGLSYARYFKYLLIIMAGIFAVLGLTRGAVPLYVVYIFITTTVILMVIGWDNKTTLRRGEKAGWGWRLMMNLGLVADIAVFSWLMVGLNWQVQKQVVREKEQKMVEVVKVFGSAISKQ